MTEETQSTPSTLKVCVVGESLLAEATMRAFCAPKGVETLRSIDGNIDEIIEMAPALTVWCDPLDIKKNDTLDDGELITGLQKLFRQTETGFLIRSTLNVETSERLIMALTKNVFDQKVAYMPTVTDSETVEGNVTQDVQIVGGEPKVVDSVMGILRNLSYFNARKVITGTFFETVYAKLAISGYRLVTQTYFDQLQHAVMDLQNANPIVVKRMVQGSGVLENPPIMLPSSLNTVQYDGRIFAGATDTLKLIDTCLEK
jgi:hypothetical protein